MKHKISVTENTLDILGNRITAQTYEPTEALEKLPLLVISGGPGFPHNYMLALSALAKDRRVIFYDQSGCGKSTLKQKVESLNFAHYSFECEEFVRCYPLERFHLLGHSWGAALALDFAVQHPEKVQSLVLASPFINAPRWVQDAKKQRAQLPMDMQETLERCEQQGKTDSPEYEEVMNTFQERYWVRIPKNRWPKTLQESMEGFNTKIYNHMNGPDEFRMTGVLKDLDLTNLLPQLAVPTLLTCGRYDTATPQTCAEYQELIPQARLTVWEQSAHLPHVEETRAYLTKLEEFLQESYSESRM